MTEQQGVIYMRGLIYVYHKKEITREDFEKKRSKGMFII